MSMKRFRYAWVLLPALGLGVVGCEPETEQPVAPENGDVEVERELDGDIEIEDERPMGQQPGVQTEPRPGQPATPSQRPTEQQPTQLQPPANDNDLETQRPQDDEEGFDSPPPVLNEEQDEPVEPMPEGGM